PPALFTWHAPPPRRHRERRVRSAAASDPCDAREQAWCKNKARLMRPASSLVNYAAYEALLHRRDFPELALERLISLPGEVGIKFAQLGRLRHEGLVRALGVVGLHLDRLFERLRANELLGGGGALLEHLLGEVRDL